VHKHLQKIYAKLGVETRTAAVMRVLRGSELA
jgi:DNA-binding NarL/FixJ family response regulator